MGIPALLDPEDMASCSSPDRLSILTYVSEFYHKFKNCQPKGSPSNPVRASKPLGMAPAGQQLRRHDSTDSAGMPLSRTPSSSGVSSGEAESGSGSSASSSVCDSPPPLAKVAEEGQEGGRKARAASEEPKKAAEEKKKEKEEEDKVVLRRRERSLASRRMVQSMYAESTSCRGGMVDSLLGEAASASSNTTPSPDIERENPFREAMMKFTAMEKQQKEKREKEPTTSPLRKTSTSRSTETPAPPMQDTKATQTSGVLQHRRPSSNRSPFRSVLNTKPLSAAVPSSQMTRSTTTSAMNKQLSYTSSPKPYLSGQINRSLSLGHALNSLTVTPTTHQQQHYQQPYDMSASYHGGSASLVVAGTPTMQSQTHYETPVSSRQQQQPEPMVTTRRRMSPSQGRPTSMYTPSNSAGFFAPPPRPLIWHSSPYSSSPSLYATPNTTANASSSEYFTPNSSMSSSSAYATPRSYYNQERMKLRIEGQSSLV